MQRIVGGIGAAIVNVTMPEDIVVSPAFAATPTIAWNKGGGRCQHDCASIGPANAGFAANSPLMVQRNDLGLSAPTFVVSGDGKIRAKTTATYATTLMGFDIYSASLVTKCVGGPRNGQLCNSTWTCKDGVTFLGDCLVTDQSNVSNTVSVADGPCGFSTCASGTNAGRLCNTTADCPISGGGTAACNAATLVPPAHTCYAQSNCGFGGTCTDCTANGAREVDALDPTSYDNIYLINAFHQSNLHNTRASALGLGTADRVYRWIRGNSLSATVCSTNCNGGVDRCVPNGPNCTLLNNCG
jgi:hypothetical protein